MFSTRAARRHGAVSRVRPDCEAGSFQPVGHFLRDRRSPARAASLLGVRRTAGHLFVVSLLVILVAWRILTFLTFPLLVLEEVSARSGVNKKQSFVILAILLSAAMMIDGLMSSRFETDEAAEVRRITSSQSRSRRCSSGSNSGLTCLKGAKPNSSSPL